MSYNISGWSTKELRDFKVRVSDVKEACNYLKEALEMTTEDGKAVRVNLPDEWGEIIGVLENGWINVASFEMGSEYSGHTYNAISKFVFPNSTGYMKALVVWEGGDSIYYLTVDDGQVTEESL